MSTSGTSHRSVFVAAGTLAATALAVTALLGTHDARAQPSAPPRPGSGHEAFGHQSCFNRVRVESTTTSPSSPRVGHPVTVKSTIRNLCPVPLDHVAWQISLGDIPVAQGTQPHVAALGSFDVAVTLNDKLSFGANAFITVVDPANVLAESNTYRPDNTKHLTVTVPMRPLFLIGGFSNCPAHFAQTPLISELKAQRGADFVHLTTHRNAWGDIDDNAVSEAAEIVANMASLKARGLVRDVDVEFDVVGFSMGGLIARTIVTKHADTLGQYKVANLVTMATPNHGANPTLADGVGWRPTHSDPCPGAAPAYSSTGAAREMLPGSSFLNDLNQRTIPSSIRVTTIAGEFLADSITLKDASCDSSCGAGPARVPVSSGIGFGPFGTLGYNDGSHAKCRVHGGPTDGHCNNDTVCPPLFDRTQVDSQWKCRGPGGDRVGLGQDGLIRVLSVKLSNSEASNIRGQHVIRGVYHTTSVRDAQVLGPNPKLLADARNDGAGDRTTPMLGTSVDAKWFFDHGDVIQTLRALLR